MADPAADDPGRTGVHRRALPRPDSLDFERFLKSGIARAQTVSGAVWTDYNEHDPGVTMLEHLCFGLTDLAYRTDHRMRDLLASVPADIGETAAYNPGGLTGNDARGDPPPVGFHSAGALFSTSPVTLDDLRRSVLSHFPEVRNVWIRRADGASAGGAAAAGLPELGVLLERSDDPADQKRHLTDTILCDAVWRLLQTEACLGTAFARPQIMPVRELRVAADIDADPAVDADPAALLSRLLFAVDWAVDPQPRMTGYGDLLAGEAAQPPDRVFDGPLSPHGVIDFSGVPAWPKSPDEDDIRAALLHTPGVVSASAVRLSLEGGAEEAAAYRPLVTAAGLAGIAIGRRHAAHDAVAHPTGAFLAEVRRRITHRRRQYRFAGEALTGVRRRIDPPSAPAGRRREGLAVYRSIQHLFPAAYGLGRYGEAMVAASHVPLTRKQHDRAIGQLRAYLILVEQYLANYLAQLANAPRLLSWQKPWRTSYFVEAVPGLRVDNAGRTLQEPPGAVDALAGPAGERHLAERLSHFARALADASAAFDPLDARAERAYDHLLARVNERFPNERLESLSAIRGGAAGHARGDRNERKRRFLADYDVLGTRRAAAAREAATPSGPPDEPKAVYGFGLARSRSRPALEERLELLTGLSEGSVRLIDHAQMGPDPLGDGVGELMIWPPPEERAQYRTPFRVGPASFAVPLADDGSTPPLLLAVRPAARPSFLARLAEGDVLVAVDDDRPDGSFGITVAEEGLSGSPDVLARSLNAAGTLAAAERLAAATADALAAMDDPMAGWRRPRGFNAFPPAFYGQRLTLIVPAAEGESESVRRLVERVFREEAPAHLTLDTYWLDDAGLAIADRGLKEWESWESGESVLVLRRMIQELYTKRLFPDDEAETGVQGEASDRAPPEE